MKTMKNRKFYAIFAILLCMTLVFAMPAGEVFAKGESEEPSAVGAKDEDDDDEVEGEGVLGRDSDVGVEVLKSIVGQAGKPVEVSFRLKAGNGNVKLKTVYPVIDSQFPFDTSGDAYKVVSSNNDPGLQTQMDAGYALTARVDLTTGYHSIRYIVEYTKSKDGVDKDYYVIKTMNIYFVGTTASTGTSGTTGGTDTSDSDLPGGFPTTTSDDSGDIPTSTTGSSGGYSGGSSSTSAPKLMITGYDTTPKKLMAGDKFTLIVHVKNTSKSTSVKNAKFLIGNEAGSFLPTSGSSAVFLDSIGPGETGDLKIEMKTSADLAQKNYILVVKGDFDDGKGNNYTSSDNLSIPVYQEVKLAVTDASTSPDAIGVGGSGTLNFTINNQGSAGVYNVNVSLKDDNAEAPEQYVGNISGNSSAYASLEVTGKADNSMSGTVKVLITYEDAEGNKGEIEQDVTCSIGEGGSLLGEEGDLMTEFDGEFPFEEEDTGLPLWAKILIGLAILTVIGIGVTVTIIVVQKKKKQKMLEEEGDLDDEDF